MLDLETFKIIESLSKEIKFGYVTGGLVGWDEIFDYEGKWYTHVYTNSLSMDKFKGKGTPTHTSSGF